MNRLACSSEWLKNKPSIYDKRPTDRTLFCIPLITLALNT